MNRIKLDRLPETGQDSETKLISVLSGKGGVGKSIISSNLADRLAAQGQKVLIVDADFSAGNQHILANVRCPHGLRQFASGEMKLGEAIVSISESVDLLGSSWTGGVVDGLDVTGAAHLARDLREHGQDYDYIVVDHCSGISRPATVLAHASDISVLLIVPELTSIADGYGLYKFLVDTNRHIDCRLIVNRCRSEEEAEQIRDRMTTLANEFLGQSPRWLGGILESDLFRKSLGAQKPLAEIAEDSTTVLKINEIARTLSGHSIKFASRIEASINHQDNEKPALADIKG
ncbi:MAG: AAA family ATPase [candidate division Zixibacteria bacterium]